MTVADSVQYRADTQRVVLKECSAVVGLVGVVSGQLESFVLLVVLIDESKVPQPYALHIY